MIYKDQDANMLPGYRFHPTDEELVRFYLRRKVENKPIRLDLIKHIDIYKYDPWDLPIRLLLPTLPRISSFIILSFLVCLHIHRSILISAAPILCTCWCFTVQHSVPYNIADLITVL
ncbi:hypothetical protein DVH24_018342 [Malus domestica]|uniref:NAC domain-containing protein n=1 Tax=Malus domestica TaxID=3750 RepID=A0A498KD80_MALDO|nr:hypothetical protein DVH24_018342 [Malus domestica]